MTRLPLKRTIEFIDFAKGYAILMVIVYHFCNHLQMPDIIDKARNFGGTGIHLFFFLSGFGLSLSKAQPFKTFIKRRLIKVYLPFALSIVLIFTADLIWRLYQGGPNEYMSHFLLYKMVDSELIFAFGGQYWFVGTIIELYLLFPLLSYLKNQWGPKTFLILCVSISVMHLGLCTYFQWFDRVTLSIFTQYLWEFGLGMYFAHRYKVDDWAFWKIKNSSLILVVVVCIPLMALMASSGTTMGKLFNDFPAFLGYTALCLLVYKSVKKVAPPLNHFFRSTGQYSYAMYLIHVLLLDIYIMYLTAWNIPYRYLEMGILIVLLYPAAIAFHYGTDIVQRFGSMAKREFMPLPSQRK